MYRTEKRQIASFQIFYFAWLHSSQYLKPSLQSVLRSLQDSSMPYFVYEHNAPTFKFRQLCERRREKEGFIFLNRQFLMHGIFAGSGSCNTIC